MTHGSDFDRIEIRDKLGFSLNEICSALGVEELYKIVAFQTFFKQKGVVSIESLYEKKIVPILTMLIFPFLGMLYHWVNQPKVTVYSLMTNVDNAIPFVRFFVLPYSIWIFYIYTCPDLFLY